MSTPGGFNIVGLMLAIFTTVASASLIGINTMLHTMQTDIQVTQALLIEHKIQHAVIEEQVRDNSTRITILEREAAILQSTLRPRGSPAVTTESHDN